MTPFTLTFPDNTAHTFTAPVAGTDIIKHFNTGGRPVYAVLVNNELYSLTREINMTAEVFPLTNATTEGSNVYRRTLCFILAAAAAELYPHLKLQVGHSLGYSYYYTFENEEKNSTEEIDLNLLEAKMKEIIAADIPIRNSFVAYR